MAYRGQVIENPVSGERITFLRTAADTDGERLVIELELPPGGRVPGLHVHPQQRERFEVIEGRMTFRTGLRKSKSFVARPGQIVDIPRDNAHAFANGGDTTVVCRVEVSPALEMEQLLETACALATERKVMKSGMPKPLHLALFVHRFRNEVEAPFPPAWMQRASLKPLAMLAKALGHAERYEREPAPLRPTTQPAIA